MKSNTALKLVGGSKLQNIVIPSLTALGNAAVARIYANPNVPDEFYLGIVSQGSGGEAMLVQANAEPRSIISNLINSSSLVNNGITTAEAVKTYVDNYRGKLVYSGYSWEVNAASGNDGVYVIATRFNGISKTTCSVSGAIVASIQYAVLIASSSHEYYLFGTAQNGANVHESAYNMNAVKFTANTAGLTVYRLSV